MHRDSNVTGGSPKSFSKILSRMAGNFLHPALKKWRMRMALALVLTVIAKFLAVSAPIFLGQAIDRIADGQAVSAVFWPFAGMIVIFGAARFLSNGLPQIRDAFFAQVTRDANRLVAVEAFAHAQAQSLQFHLTRRAGALARIIERGGAANEFLLRFLAFNIGPTIIELILAALVMAALYSWSLAIAAVVTVAVYAALTVVMTEWRNKLRRATNLADNELRAITMDTLTNFETVKSFAAEERETARYNQATSDYNKRYVRSMQSMYAMNAGQELIMSGGLVAVVLLAGNSVINDGMSVGDITAVFLMLSNIYRPLNILGFAWREIKQGAVDVENLYDLLDTPPTITDAPDAVPMLRGDGSISFEDVAYRFPERVSGVDDVSFHVAGGSFIGIVGPSGAGKSTLLRLLFRFYEPDQGRILVNGMDIQSCTQASLRGQIGLVPQEVVLFNDSLRYNIAYADPSVSDETILLAAERAQLGDFIAALPQGLDTKVGERGLKLSGGEKQRVGIARAILHNPSILVLDEATSSLDTTTELEVQKALRTAASGRTTIAVAHRLSTVVNADQLLVLQDGKIVEHGAHLELLDHAEGIYARLWHQQQKEREQPVA